MADFLYDSGNNPIIAPPAIEAEVNSAVNFGIIRGRAYEGFYLKASTTGGTTGGTTVWARRTGSTGAFTNIAANPIDLTADAGADVRFELQIRTVGAETADLRIEFTPFI